ncbi:hypothetical protein [Paenibacillus sedimenti]|uniref:Uncharacterized protein n=1 Tax=Paenibacillus sedimenti TaxID=2770274 RepID=A0A926KTG4_9BACL|nr:hypothetical protein [Paenibacillus sedimenti]MBD0381854.1 hypothetical protein [Paenibacillus sedimenti]
MKISDLAVILFRYGVRAKRRIHKSFLTWKVYEMGEGTIYYIDSRNGNDGNKGTVLEQAWKSLHKV